MTALPLDHNFPQPILAALRRMGGQRVIALHCTDLPAVLTAAVVVLVGGQWSPSRHGEELGGIIPSAQSTA